MTSRIRKLSILIIAAVMLVAMAFAGAASALDPYTDGTVKLYVNNSGTWELDEKSLGDVRAIYNSSAIGYKITSLTDLKKIGTESDIYILTQDIYCTTPQTASIIGTFTGTLIGNGHTIYNLTINGNTDYIGLVSELGEHGTLNYVNLTCANISSSGNNVGGLVGKAASASNVTGCMVMHSDVTGSFYVGGLVGRVESASLNIQNCSVENCTASGSNAVGGLVGYADSASVVSCDVKNCVVSSGSSNVGGLVGYANSASVVSCDVKNCVVSSGSNGVGGLVGYAGSAIFSGCSAMNCTVSGSNYVGGLVGGASSSSFSGCTAKECAVAGTDSDVKQLAGTGTAKDANPANNVIVDNSSAETAGLQINVTRVGATPSEYHMVSSKLTPAVSNPQTFFKELVGGQTYGYAYKSYDNTTSDVYFTVLGAYGTDGGFGYFSVEAKSTYSVTYDGNGNTSGTVPVGTVEYNPGDKVTVLENKGNLAKTGYVFNGWYNGTTLFQPGDTFTINKDTTLYANWTLSPYVEVNSWAGLNKSIAEWTNTTEARTVAVNKSILDRDVGNNTEGINVYGKIILTTNASPADNEAVINGNGLGRLFQIQNGGNLTLCGNGTSATLNLTGGYVEDYGGGVYVDSYGNLTLNDGVMITNCTADYDGGGVYVIENARFLMNGGQISDCEANYGGGVENCYGTFTMNGGSISDCDAAKYGGGVENYGTFEMFGGSIEDNSAYDGGAGVDNEGIFNISYTAEINENNAVLIWKYYDIVYNISVVSPFTGNIGNITLVDWSSNDISALVGKVIVKNGASVKDKFALSTASAYSGYQLSTSGDDLILSKKSTPSYSSSSKHSGYTQILSQGQVAPTPYATTTPSVAPTAAPTQAPATPTAKATTQATTQPTQSSPAPVAGLIAGLGAAALVLSRLRR